MTHGARVGRTSTEFNSGFAFPPCPLILWLYFRPMTIAEILADEELRQREFPVARNKIFLAHAGDCPLPRRVGDAIADYAHKCTTGDQEEFLWPGVMTTAREKASALLKCQPDEVAFVGPTSLG